VGSRLFSTSIVVVALATFVAVAGPMLDQLAAVEQFGVNRRSWVVVHLDPGLVPAATATTEQDLLALPGVDEIADSSPRELGLIPQIESPVADPGNYRTLGLDGAVVPEEAAADAGSVEGVDSAFPRTAQRPETNRAFYEQVLPMVTLLGGGLALILIIRLAFRAARTERHRGTGPFLTWVRHGAVVVVPVVLTILGSSALAALLWPPLIRPVISSLATGLILSGPVLDTGLRIALYALAGVTVLSLVAIAAERPGRHTREPG
jgi:hypothetical protein